MKKKSTRRGTAVENQKTMISGKVNINPEKNTFADEFLDVIGKDFKFDHAKGLAEWMKNSADAYATTTVAKELEHHILLRFKIATPKKNSVFECIDFVGMTKENIDQAFKKWGSTSAAKRGKAVATYGGHGNGGKFYMRQMFRTAHFITYRGGRLNVFGFNDKKNYGYDNEAHDLKMPLPDALGYAGLDTLDIPEDVKARWKKSPDGAGFTVVRGNGPDRFTGRSTVESVLERLRMHPQSRRILRHKPVYYLPEGKGWGNRLELPEIEPRLGFEYPRIISLPKTLSVAGEELDLTSIKGGTGTLTLRTSAVPLARSSELAAMNAIDVLGEVGCIGSYKMNELGWMVHGPEADFIYGEVEAAFLETKEYDSVMNDREKLVRNDVTDALLGWVREQVDAFAGEMTEKKSAQKQSEDLNLSAAFNRVLDKWKDKFMQKLSGQLFGGSGIGDAFGGSGGGGAGADGVGANDKGSSMSDDGDGSGGDGDGKGSGERDGGGGAGDRPKKAGQKFPRVLLSSHDKDPLSDDSLVHCDERHPPVYQRPEDIAAGIYWINTSRPFAKRLLERGANDVRWREYLFQRYCDIILKQSIYNLARRDPSFTPEAVDTLFDEVVARVHDAANEELGTFLFEERIAVAQEVSEDVETEEELSEVVAE